MTDQKPTGVFVRLPLSGDAVSILRKHIPNKNVTNDELINAIRAIGTPVRGGDLSPVGYTNEDAIGGLATGVYQSASIFRDEDTEHHDTVALTRLSEAQAQIASRDAEIVRLRGHVERIDKLIMGDSDPVMMFCGIHVNCTEALKGGAA